MAIMNTFQISGNIVDILSEKIFQGTLYVENGYVKQIIQEPTSETHFILPGFIDAHVHIESSMLLPAEFARLAVVHGTVGTVSDPHEIANVVGVAGVEYMITNGQKVPFKFNFGAPSCVPATSFETAGGEINADAVSALLLRSDIKYLSEMMNWPGVLQNDDLVETKIESAKANKKSIDGHAPGLTGEAAKKYCLSGMSTDHECIGKEEAEEKLGYGMKILIREGSAAKNFEALISLLHTYPESIMFCSDDKHPDALVVSHINELVKRALLKGIPLFNVLKAACLNPVLHYGLDIGLLQPNDPADFIVINDFENLQVLKTYIQGELVAENGHSKILSITAPVINNFNAEPIQSASLGVSSKINKIKVIQAIDGQLVTGCCVEEVKLLNNLIQTSVQKDILKLVVVNRYTKGVKPSIGYVNGFGLKKGAIASSVAHDSHNVIAVGTTDNDLAFVINEVINNKGGIAAFNGDEVQCLPLPIAGLMSNRDGYEVAQEYTRIDQTAKQLGSNLSSPFMTLSFMALLVIPSLKLSDLGLFDCDKFQFTDLT